MGGLTSTKDSGGIELRFGNANAMVKMIEMTARREGFGAMLAEGSQRAARAIGGGAEKLSMSVKGVELGMHEPRLKQGLGLGFCVIAHGGDHNPPSLQDTLFEKEGRPMQESRQLGSLEPMPASELSERKAAFFMDMHNWRAFKDSAVMCSFIPWDYAQTCGAVASITGWNTTVAEALRVGERAVTMARLFNVREGFTRDDDDCLSDRFLSPPTGGALGAAEQAVDRARLEAAETVYYCLTGWDPETGVPTVEKLHALGIGWAAASLAWATCLKEQSR